MMQLYYGSGSPFAWRVQIALEEKGLAYEPKLLSFSAGDLRKPDYLAMNPHGKVPVLVDGAVTLYESQAIVEYLEETYPEQPLLPSDSAERARIRIEELEATIYLNEAFRGLARISLFTPEADRDPKALADRKAEVQAELQKLEARAAARGGDFIMGSTLTRADTTWTPFIELSERAGAPINASQAPWLAAWQTRMRARPSFDKSYPPHWRKT